MLARRADGSYHATSPDGEVARAMIKEEGEEVIRHCGAPPEVVAAILAETEPGFVIT